MPRLDLLDDTTAPLTAREYFTSGDPGPIVAALANVPELLGPTLGFIGAAYGAGAASARHKEFAILRTSALFGCRYCVNAHTTVALDLGLTDDEVRSLRGELDPDEVFTDQADRRMIRWIDALAGATGPVPDDVWSDARQSFADHVLVELSATVGATIFLNRFATAFELPTSADTQARLDAGGYA
jgi:AhpD family alkylhydroperoxidase